MKKTISFVLAGLVGGIIALGGNQLLFNANAKSGNAFAKNNNISSNARSVAFNGEDAGQVPTSFTSAAEKAMPAVVHIAAIDNNEPRNERERQFYSFFGRPEPSESFGSGVIINKDGYIVTNNHVVKGADEVSVSLYDNRTIKAKVIGTDPSTDLAVIKIDEENLQPIEYANSDDARVGDWVLAVGNPFNLSSTVTAGIISAKGRNIKIIEGQKAVESFIQTDAAVNPGNSGGALVNSEGKMVGINTAIIAPTGTYAGYSFAIPVNLVKKVVLDIIKYGSVHRAMLGVSITDVSTALAKQENLDVSQGIFVEGVTDGKGASAAGVREGDVITAVDGVQVKSVPELQEQIASRNPGDVVKLTINRKGSEKSLNVTLK